MFGSIRVQCTARHVPVPEAGVAKLGCCPGAIPGGRQGWAGNQQTWEPSWKGKSAKWDLRAPLCFALEGEQWRGCTGHPFRQSFLTASSEFYSVHEIKHVFQILTWPVPVVGKPGRESAEGALWTRSKVSASLHCQKPGRSYRAEYRSLLTQGTSWAGTCPEQNSHAGKKKQGEEPGVVHPDLDFTKHGPSNPHQNMSQQVLRN